MLSRLAGALKAEMSRAAGMFQALQGRFLSLLEAYKEKVPPGEEAAGEPQAGRVGKEDVPATQAEGAEPPEAKASEGGEE
jgi:hypothetical protein